MAGKNKKTARKPKSTLKKAKNDKPAKNAGTNDKPVKEAERKKMAVPGKRVEPVKEPAPAKKTLPVASAAPGKVAAPGKIAVKELQDLAPEKSFHAVGIGASAGGLQAFEAFFRNMPPDSGMAFILITHLDPKHKSMLSELLRRYTQMPVYEAEEGMEVRPDSVYVIPPNKDMQIVDGKLYLSEPIEIRGIKHPIDFFFRSLASDFREKAICVVLSGTGSEGTLGLKAVKEEGGLVLAQKGALYPGMPDSAVNTGLVDRFVPAEKMPGLLLQSVGESGVRPKAEENRLDLVRSILSVIKAHTGHDFSLYKQNTILRRIERRMSVHKIKKLSHYVEFMKQNPYEAGVLFRELLIRVTNFLRDPEAFKVLEKEAFPLIFKGKPEDYVARFWVPGCSTGEEAYSLAILAHEYLNKIKKGYRVQIFATDIDGAAIETARNGVYPESISVDVAPGRLEKYFMKKGRTYKVRNEIRELVVFAVQDVIKDPPFSKLDLISCRNLLIYLGPELQRKVLPMFHYALNPGGILFLGSSESVGGFAEMFRTIDKKWKIYQSTRTGSQIPLNMEFRHTYHAPVAAEEKRNIPQPVGSIREMLNVILLQSYTPPGVLVNEEGSILYIHGRTGKFLEPAAGRASMNVIEMAREGLRIELQAALRKAAGTRKDVLVRNINVKTNGSFVDMDLEVRPISKPENLQGLLLVLFHELPTGKETKPAEPEKSHKGRGTELEMELKATKERLQTTIEELETSNEELKSTNEELQSSNEELQSTNEELETSREELQSVNEELVTVNSELQTKIEELSEANSYMNNLLGSTRIATIFLDRQLKIKRFTPDMLNIVNLIDPDVGRPFGDIASKLEYPELVVDSETVLKTLIPKEVVVKQKKGLWFMVRIMPYRTLEDAIEGVVLTFTDITEQKNARDTVDSALEYANSVFEAAREPMILLDRDLRVIKANSSFYNSVKLPPEKAQGRLLAEISNHQWNIPVLMKQLKRVLSENAIIRDYEMRYALPDGTEKGININARKVFRKGEKGDTVLLSIEDVPV